MCSSKSHSYRGSCTAALNSMKRRSWKRLPAAVFKGIEPISVQLRAIPSKSVCVGVGVGGLRRHEYAVHVVGGYKKNYTTLGVGGKQDNVSQCTCLS